MIVRKIKPEEYKRTLEIFAIAFGFEGDNDKSDMEVYQEVISNPKSREDAYWNERWAAFEDDDATMMGYLIAQPFPIQFDGKTYEMSGIGGVATLPQYRNTGCIRKCFEKALPALYEQGSAFSYLYPFSTCFYRKFGYEVGAKCAQYHIRLNSLNEFTVSGKCTLVEQNKLMLSEIQNIYETWQNKYNMMVVNEEYEYNWVKKSNPVKDQMFTYVYESKDGIPMGYMSLKQVNEQDGRNLWCDRFCFTCAEGLKGLFNLLLSLGINHDYVTLELPTDIDLGILLPEWSNGAVSVKHNQLGMVRVINVEKVLLGTHYIGSGKIIIQIKDEQIKQNNDTFKVTYENGKAVSVNRDNKETPDIIMGINEFSRLIIGACETSALEYMDGVTVNNDKNISQVLYKKPAYIMEHF